MELVINFSGGKDSCAMHAYLCNKYPNVKKHVVFADTGWEHTDAVEWSKNIVAMFGMELYIDWVIIGGESGNDNGKSKYRTCYTSWIKDLISECRQCETPVFVKQLGTYLAKHMELKDRHGGDVTEFPQYLQVRQVPNI